MPNLRSRTDAVRLVTTTKRLEILFCESSPNVGGEELQILLEMESFAAAGHQATLACRPRSAISMEAARRGITAVLPLAFRNSVHLPSVIALRRLIAQRKVDVAFCHSGHDANNLALAARLVRKRPTLIRERTYQLGIPKAYSYNRLVDLTFVPSHFLRQQILANTAIDARRIVVLRPLVPVAKLEQEAQAPLSAFIAQRISQGSPVIVHAAMLRPEKGHWFALQVIAQLKRKFSNLLYVIAGEGGQHCRLAEETARLKLDRNVVFAGFVRPIAPLYAHADLVIMPSSYEPLGLSQIEAMALGVAVAVSDVGGLPETVRHGETGLVLPVDDVDAWVRSLGDLLVSRERRKSLGAAGRASVVAAYSPASHLSRLLFEIAQVQPATY